MIDKSTRDKIAKVVDYLLQATLWLNVVILPVAFLTSVREWCFSFAVFWWLNRCLFSGRWRVTPTPVWPWLVVLTGCIVLSIFFAVDPRYSFSELRGEWLKGLLWFYLVVLSVDERWKARAFLGAVFAGALLMVGYGVVHSFFSPHWSSILVSEHSLHSGVGTLSTYLVLVIPLLFLGLHIQPNRWARLGTSVLILGSLYLAVMAGQRAAWLALAVVLPFLPVVLTRRWRTTIVAVTLVLIVVSMGLMFLPRSTWVRFDKNIPTVDSSPGRHVVLMSARRDVWRAGLRLTVRHPLTGVGYGRASPRGVDPAFRRYPAYWHAHNTFLNIGAGTGLIGLLAFIGLVLSFIWRGFSMWRGKRGLESVFGGGLMLMMIGFWTRNSFNDFFVDDTALLFWMLAGLLYAGAWRHAAVGRSTPAEAGAV